MVAVWALVLNPTDIAVYRELTRFNDLYTVGNPLLDESLGIEFEADVAVCHRNTVDLADSEHVAVLLDSSQ